LSKSLGCLGDLFPDKEVRCRIRGCNNYCRYTGEAALHEVAATQNKTKNDKMCSECFERYKQLENKEIACSTDSCEKTWTWNRFQQLESLARGFNSPPNGFCNECRVKLVEIGDQEIKCRMKGCEKTWTWRAREQAKSGSDKPQPKLCNSCYAQLQKLEDKELPCRIHGCNETFTWKRYQQLEHILSKKDNEKLPSKMCKKCFDTFSKLQDKEIECSTNNCTRTWKLSRFKQLELLVSNRPDPSKLCSKCFGFSQHAKDRKINCSLNGCHNYWTYTKEMQMQDWLKGIKFPEPKPCVECSEKLAQLQDATIPCEIPNCDGTCPYPVMEQHLDNLANKTKPTARRCSDCEKFLNDKTTQNLICQTEGCENSITWTAYEQLLCKKESFTKPTLCSDCNSKVLANTKTSNTINKIEHKIIKIPVSGPWQKVARIRDWPKHITHDLLAQVEKATHKIIVFSDDAGLNNNPEQSWTNLLEKRLNHKLGDKAQIMVINASIAESTSAEAIKRIKRDILPFEPTLVLYSFVYADGLIYFDAYDNEWRRNIKSEESLPAMEQLSKELKTGNFKTLCWTPNPFFPEEHPEAKRAKRQGEKWANAQHATYEEIIRNLKTITKKEEIPILDLASRFEINGAKSAKKWMSDWHTPNAVGNRNIAMWFTDIILKENLLSL